VPSYSLKRRGAPSYSLKVREVRSYSLKMRGLCSHSLKMRRVTTYSLKMRGSVRSPARARSVASSRGLERTARMAQGGDDKVDKREDAEWRGTFGVRGLGMSRRTVYRGTLNFEVTDRQVELRGRVYN